MYTVPFCLTFFKTDLLLPLFFLLGLVNLLVWLLNLTLHGSVGIYPNEPLVFLFTFPFV